MNQHEEFFPAKEVENFNDAFLALDQDNSGEMEAEGDYLLSSYLNAVYRNLRFEYYIYKKMGKLHVCGDMYQFNISILSASS